MNFMGIDPGTKCCGYGIIKKQGSELSLVSCGTLKPKSRELKKQIIYISECIEEIHKNYHIDIVAMEDIFFAFNPKTVIKLAQLRGALILKLLQKFRDFDEFTPLQIKKTLTGRAKASKLQVAFMVKQILKYRNTIKSYDITDAIAVAITSCYNRK